jgi:hypothetical protein
MNASTFNTPSWVRGKKQIDLAQDLPPDLIIEIDITSPSFEQVPHLRSTKDPGGLAARRNARRDLTLVAAIMSSLPKATEWAFVS